MAKEDALAQLRDIHLPEQIGWWPLASGWYVLMMFAVLSVIALVYYFYKKHLNSLPKKKALELLKTYALQYEKDRNTQLASARISELLRRVALVYYPRTQVASIHGDGWIDFLNQTGKDVDFTPVKSMLLDSPFKTSETVNLKPLINRAEQWIKQRGVPCLN